MKIINNPSFVNTIKLYRSSIIIFFSLFLSILFLQIFNEPPKLPLNPFYTPIDCNHISVNSINIDNSKIIYNLQIGEFVEFPRSSAIHLLRVINIMGGTIIEYLSKNFWDISSNISSINFTILQSFTGPISTTLFCGPIPIAQHNFTLQNLTVYPIGYSRGLVAGHTVSTFIDSCFYNKSLILFSQSALLNTPIRTSFNTNISTIYSFLPMLTFYQSNHSKFIERPTYFISIIPKTLWQLISDIIIPLWGCIFSFYGKIPFNLYFLNNQTYLFDNLKPFLNEEPLLIDSNICFREGTFIRAPGSISTIYNSSLVNKSTNEFIFEHLQWILTFRPDVISKIKNLYSNQQIINKRIVIDQYISQYLSLIKNVFPTYTIDIIPDSFDLFKIADIIGSAEILIVSSIQSLFYSIFLNSNSNLIELQPLKVECIELGKIFAKFSNSKYFNLNQIYLNNNNCICNNLNCNLNIKLEYPKLTIEMLKNIPL